MSSRRPFVVPPSRWTLESLRRATEEVHALRALYDCPHDATWPTEVTPGTRGGHLRCHAAASLEMAEAALDAASSSSRSLEDGSDLDLDAVPELEVAVRLMGPRLRGGPVTCQLDLPPGYPETAAPRVRVECASPDVSWRELRALHDAAVGALFRV